MNVFDYFFENTRNLDKDFLVGDSETSFKILFKNSIKLASFLRGKYGENNKIAVVSENSSFFILVYLSILKSNNICIPLSTLIEKDNLGYIIESSGCDVFFVDDKSLQKLIIPKHVDLLSSSFIGNWLENETNFEPGKEDEATFDEHRIAEIIYTSGSTNVPKGVMLSHKNVRANTESIVQYLKLSDKDRVLVVMPFYYCYGLSLLHTHLRVGGSLVLNNSFMFLGSVLNDLSSHNCTGFAGVPSHFQILLNKSKKFRHTKFPDLRYVTQAGGKLHDVFIKDFITSFPEVDFYVMYGQTEATARLSYLDPKMLPLKIGSVGKGIPGVQLKIVDADGKELEVEKEGEIVAKGDNIMQGYFDDMKQTKETLKNGWLHTGDVGFKDEDGFIYIVGRKKDFIKVSGKRVSPKEVEKVILNIENIKNCKVKGEESQLQGEIIVAEVVAKDAYVESELIDEVISECRHHLALYKVPSKVVVKEKLRISSSGKYLK